MAYDVERAVAEALAAGLPEADDLVTTTYRTGTPS